MTYRAIAEELGISHTDVRRIERRALEKLRSQYEDWLEVIWDMLPADKDDPTIYADADK